MNKARILLLALACTCQGATLQATDIAEDGDKDSVRYAVTTLSANYMRENPDFTAELGDQALMGTPVKIVAEEGYWKRIVAPSPYTAWCVDLGLKEMSGRELEEYIASDKMICTADYSKVLSRPSAESGKICDIVMGDIIPVTGRCRNGYIEVRMVTGETGYVKKKDTEDFRKWAAGCRPVPENIVRTAMRFLGVPYLWGGASIKGVDCSGFTRMVWFMNGMLLPRNASRQANAGIPVAMDCDTAGFPPDSVGSLADSPAFREEMIKRTAALKTGDLIFFGDPVSHVGIYLGEGKFIHASRFVRINSLIPGEEGFYEMSVRMTRARRMEGDGVTAITASPAYFPQKESPVLQ